MAAAKDLGLRGDDAAKVRKRIGDVAQRALEKLATELEIYKPTARKKARGGRHSEYHVDDVVANGVPVSWVERFAKLADQLRRDYVIDESADQDTPAEQPEPKPAEPLSVLKLVKKRG